MRQLPSHAVRKVVGLNGIDGMVQFSLQVAIYALGRDIQLIYRFNDNVVISVLVL